MPIAQDPSALLLRQVAPVLERFLERSGASEGDFAQVEEAGRTAVLAFRGLLMSAGLQASLASAPQAYQCPACGSKLSPYGSRQRHVVTAEGEAAVCSVRYRCLGCEEDHYPLEAANGLSDGHYTTGAKGLIAAKASRIPYERAAQVLAERGVSVSAKQVDRKVAEVSGWREAEERAVVGQLGAKVRAGRLPPRRGHAHRQSPRQVSSAPPTSTLPARPPLLASPSPLSLHTWSGWQKEMAAVLSVDGGKVRSPVAGPQGLEWFEARLGVIAPVLAQPVPSPEALVAIDAAGAWPQEVPAKRPDAYPSPSRRRGTRGRRARRRAGQPSSPPAASSASARTLGTLGKAGQTGKAAPLYLAGPTSLAGPQEIAALFRLLVAARQSDPHPGRVLLFIADGADWIWWRVALFFPTARQVLDIYHAAEHVASAARACWGEGSPEAQHWSERARTMLLARGGPERVRQALHHQLQHGQPADPEALRVELAYLHEHRDRMPYAELHAQGLPVGSGAMESAVKQMSTQRLRQPGMMWTRQGAERMLRLRAAYLSGDLQHTIQREHARLQASTTVYAPKASTHHKS